MPKPEQALRAAPGVLAVKVNYESGQATIGYPAGEDVRTDEIMGALESLGYRGQIVQSADRPD